MSQLEIDALTSAFVMIDLQRGIVARDTAPHPSSVVVANCARIAERFRAAGGLVVAVRVSFAEDRADMLCPPNDAPPLPPPPQGWDELVAETGPHDRDLLITKHQWGAFYGTELDLQLRRRGIRTFVIGGISTNFGVESTARDGWERGYAVVFAEDAMAGLSSGAHEFAVSTIFPRLGRVRSTEEIVAAIR